MENLYCTFYLEDIYYGFPVSDIQEILQNQEIFIVPLAKPILTGLINLRGQVISVLNLKKILNSNEEFGPIRTQLITQTSIGILGLEINDVHEIIPISQDKKISPPASLSGNMKKFVSSAFKLSEEILLVLDIESIASID